MSCTRTRQLLDAWMDDELDPSTRDEITAHFPQCVPCDALRTERERMRDAIRALPREAAPAALVASVRRALAHETEARDLRRRGPSWWQAAAFAGCAAALAAALTLAWVRIPDTEAPGEMAVASHVAALARARAAPASLVEVAASDRHVVKPWFQGKLDFSPPVRDLAAVGFTLLGARVDRIGAHPAAVVVYRIRNHPIDLYVWSGDAQEMRSVQLASLRGFGVATWAQQGLRFAAVSDVDAADLERFARALQPPS